jgi:hypothetical protein
MSLEGKHCEHETQPALNKHNQQATVCLKCNLDIEKNLFSLKQNEIEHIQFE